MRKCDIIPNLLFYFAKYDPMNFNLINDIIKNFGSNYFVNEEIVYIYNIHDFFK